MASDNNPKRAQGELKVPLELMPTVAETYISLVLENGAKKYGRFNWRKEPISITTYVGAIRRHVGAIMDGQDIDPDSGLPHWAHIGANCVIALDALSLGKLIDDRETEGMAAEVLAEIAARRKRNAEPSPLAATAPLWGRDILNDYLNRLNVNYGENLK